MLSGTLGDILGVLESTLSTYPRRVPGVIQLEGRELHYVDLHSFYHQSVQIFANNLYEFSSSTSAPLILDCGAHIGLASLYFTSRYPGCKIIAYEADPIIAQALKKNVISYGLQNVTVEAKAVWTDNSGVSFSEEFDDSGHIGAMSGGKVVPSVRLKDVISQSPIELLKMDVEGAEFALFKDCASALHNVNKIIVEVHQLRSEGKLGELLSVLESAGFRYILSDLHQAVWVTDYKKPPFSETKTDRYLVSVFAWRE